MNRFLSSFALLLTIVSSPTFAETPSSRISKAVETFRPLAGSGIETYKVKPSSSVKAMLLELALNEGSASSSADFNWVGTSADAWEPDSINFGETDMKQAYSYIFTPTDEDDSTPAAQLNKAKAGFKLLLGTGVKFGVVPLGAIQCGVRFAALAIIDPVSGKIYTFAKEGSGC